MTCANRIKRLWTRIGRQKLVGQEDTHTSLHRCLSTLQLTSIGLGATIGVGIYVLLGVAIKEYAGPGVILSFLIAGLICLTNALIFAEFGSRIPHTGAAYTYVYKTVGELAAFLTGWMYLISGACSGATGARAWSGFVDSLFNNNIQTYLDDKVGQLDIGPPFARSLDWVAFIFYLVVTFLVSLNVNCSSIINTVLAIVTTGVLVFVTFAGVIIGDVKRIGDTDQGFLPFGLQGVIVGASAAFYAFNGFDNICLAAEEAKDPVQSVPRAILIEMAIVTVVYCGSAVGTLSLIPYTEIDLRAPIPSAFAFQGVEWARYLVTIGPVIAITNLNILSLFALSRTAYRMAKDGMLFARFGYINARTKTPLFGVIVFGIFMSVASLLLELKDLVRFAVLCMLFQYIILAPALIALRASSTPMDTIPQVSEASPVGFEIIVPSPDEDEEHETGDRDVRVGNGVPRDGDITFGIDAGDENDMNVNRAEMNPLVHAATGTVTSSNDRMDKGLKEILDNPQNHLTSVHPHTEDGSVGSGSLTPNQDGSPNKVTDVPTVDLINIRPEPRTNINDDVSDSSIEQINVQSSMLDISNLDLVTETGHSDTNLSQMAFQDGLLGDFSLNALTESDNERNLRSAFYAPDKMETSRNGAHAASKSTTAINKNNNTEPNTKTGKPSPKKCGFLGQFFKILTTTRTVLLLVACLAGLSVQIGMGWEDLQRGNGFAVMTTTLLGVLSVFFCEILRRRCSSDDYDGFKVPFVPYIPALSCFLNMMLLVSAADVMGLVEFAVLTSIGFILYIIMVMTEKTPIDEDNSEGTHTSEESYALLAHEDNVDSDGSL